MATLCPFRWKDPALLLIGIPRQQRLENARADRNVPSSLWGLAVVNEVATVRPVQVFPPHCEYFLLVSHSGIAHNHEHVSERLFAKRQKPSFNVFVDDALPLPFLLQSDLWSCSKHSPLFRLAEHTPKRAKCIVVIRRTAWKTEHARIVLRNCVKPHRAHARFRNQPPSVRVIIFRLLFHHTLVIDPIKEPVAKLTKHRAASQQKNASSFLGLSHGECLDSSSGRKCSFLRGSPVTSTVNPEAEVINPTSLVKSHRLSSMCPHGWLLLVGSDVCFYVCKIILYPATEFHVSRTNSGATPITKSAFGHVPHSRQFLRADEMATAVRPARQAERGIWRPRFKVFLRQCLCADCRHLCRRHEKSLLREPTRGSTGMSKTSRHPY